MAAHDGLAERFEAHRGHLRAAAYRMLGSRGEAADADRIRRLDVVFVDG